jgi:hypothetical protein
MQTVGIHWVFTNYQVECKIWGFHGGDYEPEDTILYQVESWHVKGYVRFDVFMAVTTKNGAYLKYPFRGIRYMINLRATCENHT